MIIFIIAVDLLCIIAVLISARTIHDLEKRLEEEIINNEKLASVINELAEERKIENGK